MARNFYVVRDVHRGFVTRIAPLSFALEVGDQRGGFTEWRKAKKFPKLCVATEWAAKNLRKDEYNVYTCNPTEMLERNI
jgi:hypothetical protein